MLHVVPPQTGHDFVVGSPIANDAGWIDVDQYTLQHTKYKNIFGMGDACSTANAKTAAAARKQAPIVAANLLRVMNGQDPVYHYDGYGSCPLTVENGKVILAEFGYGGKIIPSFPGTAQNPQIGVGAKSRSVAVDVLERNAQGARMAGCPKNSAKSITII